MARASRTKQAQRLRTRPTMDGQIISSMAPRQTTLPNDPPVIERNVRVSKLVEFTVQAPSTAPLEAPITAAKIAGAIPGGSTYWSSIRISKIAVWARQMSTTGLPDMPIGLRVESNADWSQPNSTWTDNGIPGQARPKVAALPGLLTRSRWFGTADTTLIASVIMTNGQSAIVQVSIELLSTATTAFLGIQDGDTVAASQRETVGSFPTKSGDLDGFGPVAS